MNDNQMADALFGGSMVASAPPAPTSLAGGTLAGGASTATPAAPKTDEQLQAERLFSGSKDQAAQPAESTQALRQDPERVLHKSGAQDTFRDVLPDNTMPEFGRGPTASDIGLQAQEAREVCADLQAERQDVSQFVQLAMEAKSATDEQVAGWRAQSERMIRERGFDAGDLRLAQRLVQRDPRVAEYLDATGLGNHPQVVARFVELARSQAARGRL